MVSTLTKLSTITLFLDIEREFDKVCITWLIGKLTTAKTPSR